MFVFILKHTASAGVGVPFRTGEAGPAAPSLCRPAGFHRTPGKLLDHLLSESGLGKIKTQTSEVNSIGDEKSKRKSH